METPIFLDKFSATCLAGPVSQSHLTCIIEKACSKEGVSVVVFVIEITLRIVGQCLSDTNMEVLVKGNVKYKFQHAFAPANRVSG